MFKPGDKVVCVDASPVQSDCASAMPLKLTKDATYTVRSVHTEPNLEGYGIRLDELLNPSTIWADGEEKEWSYAASRFRPLKPMTAELDISALCGRGAASC